MGKLILCKGSYAKRPYYMSVGDINIYSIEELCFYIANNLDIIIELDLNKSLMDWIKDQLKMEDLASKLYKLQEEAVSNRFIIQTILNSCNYFTSSQKVRIIQTISEIENLPLLQRKVKKANSLLFAKNYLEAQECYESIIEGEMAGDLSAKEYGQILHNLGITKLFTLGVRQASIFFKHAYEVNQEEESLKQYLLCLKLSNQEDMFVDEINRLALEDDFISNLLDDYKRHLNDYEYSQQYKKIIQLNKLLDADKPTFMEAALHLCKDIEKQYRRCTNEHIW